MKSNLKFLSDSLEETRESPATRLGPVSEAEGCVPLIRKGLMADDTLWTQATLIADEQITSKNWRNWWKELVKKDDTQFHSEVESLLKVIDMLKTIVSFPEER